jgi:hypothetical protein
VGGVRTLLPFRNSPGPRRRILRRASRSCSSGRAPRIAPLGLPERRDCVAGVGGLEPRNPSGSKSARGTARFFKEFAETAQQRLFACELRGCEYAAGARISAGISGANVGAPSRPGLFNMPGWRDSNSGMRKENNPVEPTSFFARQTASKVRSKPAGRKIAGLQAPVARRRSLLSSPAGSAGRLPGSRRDRTACRTRRRAPGRRGWSGGACRRTRGARDRGRGPPRTAAARPF